MRWITCEEGIQLKYGQNEKIKGRYKIDGVLDGVHDAVLELCKHMQMWRELLKKVNNMASRRCRGKPKDKSEKVPENSALTERIRGNVLKCLEVMLHWPPYCTAEKGFKDNNILGFILFIHYTTILHHFILYTKLSSTILKILNFECEFSFPHCYI